MIFPGVVFILQIATAVAEKTKLTYHLGNSLFNMKEAKKVYPVNHTSCVWNIGLNGKMLLVEQAKTICFVLINLNFNIAY